MISGRISSVFSVRYPAGMLISLISIFALLGIFRPVKVFSQDTSLSYAQCDSLFDHTMKVAFTDSAFPLTALFTWKRKDLTESASRKIQNNHCMKKFKLIEYECMMKAVRFSELSSCIKVSISSDETVSISESVENKNPIPSATGVQIINSRTVPVNLETCKKSYEKMLYIYEKNSERSSEDDKRYLKVWKTPEAQSSFETRCLQEYRPADLGCIMNAADTGVLQACLVSIPSSK
jgi:hypothetical protein